MRGDIASFLRLAIIDIIVFCSLPKLFINQGGEKMEEKPDIHGPFKTLVVPEGVGVSFWKQALKYHFTYSMSGLIIGILLAVLGVILFFHGVGGSISWTAKLLGLESQINDAPPGAVLFL